MQAEPDVLLTEIHRQAADNPILRLADQIRRGVLAFATTPAGHTRGSADEPGLLRRDRRSAALRYTDVRSADRHNHRPDGNVERQLNRCCKLTSAPVHERAFATHSSRPRSRPLGAIREAPAGSLPSRKRQRDLRQAGEAGDRQQPEGACTNPSSSSCGVASLGAMPGAVGRQRSASPSSRSAMWRATPSRCGRMRSASAGSMVRVQRNRSAMPGPKLGLWASIHAPCRRQISLPCRTRKIPDHAAGSPV